MTPPPFPFPVRTHRPFFSTLRPAFAGPSREKPVNFAGAALPNRLRWTTINETAN